MWEIGNSYYGARLENVFLIIANPSALNNDKEQSDIQVPSWIESEKLKVIFTPRSLNDLENILLVSKFTNKEDLRQAIVDVLQEDPRSNYRKDKCSDKLYYFNIDNVKITCWFDEDATEVLKIA